jgi:hypothetical protein
MALFAFEIIVNKQLPSIVQRCEDRLPFQVFAVSQNPSTVIPNSTNPGLLLQCSGGREWWVCVGKIGGRFISFRELGISAWKFQEGG